MLIAIATLSDLRFVLQQQAAESNAVGFIPRPRLELEVAKGRVLVAREGRLRLGYAFLGSCRSGVLTIHQCVTERGVRRREIGSAFVQRIALQAAVGGATSLRLHCREELEANAFWSAMGFTLARTQRGGRGRGLQLHTWRLPLLRVTRSDI